MTRTIHPREHAVRAAEIKLREAIATATAGLTEAEALRAVNAVASEWIATCARYAIREERHGDTSKPGGLT